MKSLPIRLTAVAATLMFTAGLAQAQDCGTAMPAFQAALKSNTAEALSAFIDQYPGCFSAPAQAKLKALGGAPAAATAPTPTPAPAPVVQNTSPPVQPTPEVPQVAANVPEGLDQARQNAATCTDGLKVLSDNLYVYPNNPAVAAGTPLSWNQAYGQFSSQNLTACRALGEFVQNNSDHPTVTEMLATFDTQEYYATFLDYFDGAFGIVSQGSRIPSYCPQLHLIQFNCVTASERITLSSKLLAEQIEHINGM